MCEYIAGISPVKVYGLPLFHSTGEYRKLTDELMEQVPSIRQFGHLASGGRICFKTDAPSFVFKSRVKICADNETTSNLFSSGFNVYIGERQRSRYAGYVCVEKNRDGWCDIEKRFEKQAIMEDITIFMPSASMIESCCIIPDENYRVEESSPYKWGTPIVYYGSSITAGGAASRVGNTYVSLLSRWLDTDYQLYGFPGNAKGEKEVAEYLSTLDMSVFVYDYDHNAKDPEELEKTHKPFFDIIRKAKPKVPVIMLSRPGYDHDPVDAEKRKAVIRSTYETAKAAGDENVWFIEGNKLFGTDERHACTIDGIHPTDYGFMKMARCIAPILEEALEKQANQ